MHWCNEKKRKNNNLYIRTLAHMFLTRTLTFVKKLLSLSMWTRTMSQNENHKSLNMNRLEELDGLIRQSILQHFRLLIGHLSNPVQHGFKCGNLLIVSLRFGRLWPVRKWFVVVDPHFAFGDSEFPVVKDLSFGDGR